MIPTIREGIPARVQMRAEGRPMVAHSVVLAVLMAEATMSATYGFVGRPPTAESREAFDHSRAAIEAFAEQHNLRIDAFVKDQATWTLLFRNPGPIGGVGQVIVSFDSARRAFRIGA